MDYEFILLDRIQKIQQIINEYGEENFCISFSGGKDSTVLSALIDEALPNNNIPRVYANTGIELNMIIDFVKEKRTLDNRIEIIQPQIPIQTMLQNDGYPFKNKNHSKFIERYQRLGLCDSVLQYLGERDDKKPWSAYNTCPKKLRYQFTENFNLKISDKCCVRLKEEPLLKWQEIHNKPYAIIGIMREEGGRRRQASCLSYRNKKLKAFQPMAPLTKDWEDWYIKINEIEICGIYNIPYNFPRTGCKGCPFSINLQHELDILEKFFPNERKQCEIIWKPIYDEYRRIGYRLK